MSDSFIFYRDFRIIDYICIVVVRDSLAYLFAAVRFYSLIDILIDETCRSGLRHGNHYV